MPYQQRWVLDNSPVKVCEKSRRVGLSWAEAAISTIKAARAGKSGCDTWYIAANEAGAMEFMLDCAFWAKQYNIAATAMQEVVIRDEDKDILAYQIRFASGYRVTGLTSRPTNLRGKQGRVVADEFAFHPDPGGLLKAAIALLMWGGQVCLISTHNGIDNPFNQLVLAIRAQKRNYSLHRITLDDALDDGLYRRICQTQGKPWTLAGQTAWRNELVDTYGDDAEEELFCNPRSSAVVYLPSMLVEARMRVDYPVLRLSLQDDFVHQRESEKDWWMKVWLEEHLQPLLLGLNREHRHYFGEDFGRNGDLSVFAPIAEESTLTRYCPFLFELRNVPFKQQEQCLEFMVNGLPNFIGGAMDARGNGQHLAEFAGNKWGSKIAQVKLTNNDYGVMVPRYKTALEDGSLWLPKDADVLADHRAVRMVNGVAKVPESSRYKEENSPDGKKKRHGDSFIALVLGLTAACEHPEIIQSHGIAKVQVHPRSEVRDIFGAVAGRGGGKGLFA